MKINGFISTQIQLSNLVFHKGTRLKIKKFHTEYFLTIIAYFTLSNYLQSFDALPNPFHLKPF